MRVWLQWFLEFQERQRLLVVSLLIAIVCGFGWIAYHAEIQAFPEFTNTQVQVITQFPGKAAEEVERQITIPVEVATNGLPDLAGQRSISMFGLSVVTLTFADDVKSRQARLDVTQRLSDLELPEGIKPTLSPDSTPVGEIFRYTLVGSLPSSEMRLIEDWVLERELKSIPGVADVVSFGGPIRTVDVSLDIGRIKKFGLGSDDVADALAKNHINAGGTSLSRGEESFIVRSLGMFRTPESLEQAVVASRNSTPIKVRDLGSVRFGERPRNGQVGRNENDDIVEGIILLRQGADTLETCDRIRQRIALLNEKVLPAGAQISGFYDRTVLIRTSAATVTHNVLFGISLVCILLLIGFGTQYWVFVVGVSLIIPFALAVALVGVRLFGYTPNLISLGAVDFGIIVETAIFAAEALILSLAGLKKRDSQSLSDTLSKVLGPSLLCALLLLVAFVPILTLQQVEGKIFKPLGVTLVCALLGGQLGAILLIPLFSIFAPLGPPPKRRLDEWEHRLVRYLAGIAGRLSQKARLPTIVFFFLVIPIFILYLSLGREFLPNLNEGAIYARATGPKTLSLGAMNEVADKVRLRLRDITEVTDVVTQIGRPDDGTDVNGFDNLEFFVKLKPPGEWRSASTIDGFMDLCSKRLSDITGVEFTFSQPIKDNVDEAISGVKGELVLKLFGKDLDVLQSLALEAKALIKQVPGAIDIMADEPKGQPELRFEMDKDKLSRFGLTASAAESVIEAALLGKKSGRLLDSENRFLDILVKLGLPPHPTAEMINTLPILSPGGGSIPLGEVSNVHLVEGISRIYREQGQRRAAIRASVRDRPVVDVVNAANRLLTEKLKMPAGYHYEWAGSFENAKRAADRLMIVVPLCLLFLIILLHAWFKNWRLVGLALWQVPFGTIGGLCLLKICGLNLSISAAAGIIVLMGVTLLTGIMILSAWIAHYDADLAMERTLKGVVLSSGVAIVGLIPAAFSHGIGAETARPFAVSILGGLVTSLLLTLFIFPALLKISSLHKTP